MLFKINLLACVLSSIVLLFLTDLIEEPEGIV